MDTLKPVTNKYLDKIKNLLLIGLTLLFPLNQQLHVKPFPSVDGFIIDYLILKISIPEIFLILLTIFQIKAIFETVRANKLVRNISLVFLIFSVISGFLSRYSLLAIYENFIILLLILNLPPLIRDYSLNLDLFVKSVKIWLILLSLLGLFQFSLQKSVLNNYPLFGEFPYSEDYYHIKQKGFLFENMIPPYAIFSHSNIFGGYVLLSLMFLCLVRKDSIFYHLLSLFILIIAGSLNILICYFIWLILVRFTFIDAISIKFPKVLFVLITIYFAQLYMSLNYFEYSSNFSLYRRLYMFDLSFNFFIENPKNLFISGYYNYFYVVKDPLYKYEIVRFFQPPHNLFNLLIWQYGVLFLLSFFIFLNFIFKIIPQNLGRFISIILLASMFDHFFLTNHQLKIFIFLIIPYSLIAKNSIK